MLSAAGLDFPLEAGDVAARVNFCTLDAAGNVTDRRAGRIPDADARAVVDKLQARCTSPASRSSSGPSASTGCSSCCAAPGLDPRLGDTDPQHTGVPPLAAGRSTPTPSAPPSSSPSSTRRCAPCSPTSRRPTSCCSAGSTPTASSRASPTRYRLKAAAVAIYPMYRGIARLVGMDVLGRPANLDEQLAILRDSWDDYDYFFLHHKYTDSAGEDGDRARKIAAIEDSTRSCPTCGRSGPT